MIKATINLYIDLFTTLAKSHNHSNMSFGIELSIETEKLFEFGTHEERWQPQEKVGGCQCQKI